LRRASAGARGLGMGMGRGPRGGGSWKLPDRRTLDVEWRWVLAGGTPREALETRLSASFVVVLYALDRGELRGLPVLDDRGYGASRSFITRLSRLGAACVGTAKMLGRRLDLRLLPSAETLREPE
jgi:hypothetical protein